MKPILSGPHVRQSPAKILNLFSHNYLQNSPGIGCARDPLQLLNICIKTSIVF